MLINFMSRFALILVNPHSGRGKSLAIANELSLHSPSFGFRSEIVLGDSAVKSLDLLRQKLMNKPDLVLVIGGDGLFNLALQVIAETGIPLFVVPAGTGNDFARSSGFLATDPQTIWGVITTKQPGPIDLALVNKSRWYGQIMSTGFDSTVNRRANKFRLIKGQMKYNLATILELPKFKPLRYEIAIDGKSIHTDAMMVTIGNGPSYGGGMQILPQAKRDDGLLDIMVIRPVSKFELLKVFPKVFEGKHVSHPAIDFYTGREIAIISKALAYADGEYFGEGSLKVEVKPATLITWTSS